MKEIKEISGDLYYIKHVFEQTKQRKQEVEGEALALIRNFRVSSSVWKPRMAT